MSEVRIGRANLDIEADIERIIAYYPPLTHDRHYLEFTVQNGAATLSGHTRTGITRRYLINAVAQVPDVVRVEADDLYSDGIIRLDLGRLIPVGVIANVVHGVVVLTGELPEGSSEAEIVATVQNVPGVRAVHTQFQ